MSQAAYDRQLARLELYQMLQEGAADAAAGDKGLGHKEMIRTLKMRL